MPDLFQHELSSYQEDLEGRDETLRAFLNHRDRSRNLTHFGFAITNRANLIVVGLTTLVEAKLYEIATDVERTSIFKVSDLKGSGLERLKVYLSRKQVVDVEKCTSWSSFQHLYTIRCAIVHGHGVIVQPFRLKKVCPAVKALKIQHVLFGPPERVRIIFDTKALRKAHDIASRIIGEITTAVQNRVAKP